MVLYGENEIDCWKKEKRGITSDGKKTKKTRISGVEGCVVEKYIKVWTKKLVISSNWVA